MAEQLPVCDNSTVHLFLANLLRYRQDKFAITFLPDHPAEELRPSSLGTLRLESWDGNEYFFSASNVRFDRAVSLAGSWGMKSESKTRWRHRRVE